MPKRLRLGCDKTAYLSPPLVEEYEERRQRQERAGTWPRVTCSRRIQEKAPDLIAWIEDYGHYDAHGVLPEPGGFTCQDARWGAAMRVIRSAFKRADDD